MPTYARGWRWETVMLAVMPASPACVLSSARVPYGVKPYTYRICLDCDERVRDTPGAWRAQ